MFSPRLRKLTLLAHVTSSVGWMGAVAAFLALAVSGVASRDPERVRAAYLAMELTGWCVIVPLSFAAPMTGIVQALGTSWGLVRHYWVVVKLLVTVPCTFILLLHMQPTKRLAVSTVEAIARSNDLAALQVQLIADSIAALLVLVLATALAIYKPPGLTPYGARKLAAATARAPVWVRVFGGVVAALVSTFVVVHLAGGGLGSHHGGE